MTGPFDPANGNVVPQPWVRPGFFGRLARKLMPKDTAKIEREFRSWVWSKDPHEEFAYRDTENCCFAQFLREAGYATKPGVGGVTWDSQLRDGQLRDGHPIPSALVTALYGPTFGDVARALER